ncbi:hypothetical protein C8R44DRAFT_643669 [Mycena epipterygia]|nr:hypothetical protein C8R44DRAFT_643669 [Mycena epipterygia]
MPQEPPEDARESVSLLLTRASSYPCSVVTPAFSRLAQSTSTFQLALDALLPVLDSETSCELTERILVSFILFSLYAPHPISINPFKSVLAVTFIKEREKALAVADTGGVASNEPLVWVLWKILKGDGEDIGPYSPSVLARSPLPPNFRAGKLILDDTLYHTASDFDDVMYSYFSQSNAPHEATEGTIAAEVDEHNEVIANAMRLLLSARSRVLTLSEQRRLLPFLPVLAASSLVAPPDLEPLVAHNPGLAHPLLRALLGPSSMPSASPSPDLNNSPATHPTPAASPYLTALTRLPPTLPTLDVLGRLLRDGLVPADVLSRFVAEAIDTLDRAEREDADDGWAQGVRHLCRFYTALLSHGLAPASSALAHFSLRHARFQEAGALYRVLCGGGIREPEEI